MNILLAYFHILALPIGLTSVTLRGVYLKESLKTGEISKIFFADNVWGLTAALWVGTGLVRLFAGYDKGTLYYMHSHWFWLKMVLFLGVFALEIYPMVTFIRWRTQRKGSVDAKDHAIVKKILKLNFIEQILVVLIPIAAVAMARGGVFT